MIYKGGTDKVPEYDLLTYLFDSIQMDDKHVLHVDAEKPNIKIDRASALLLCKKIGYVFRELFGIGANGIGKDVVLFSSTGQVMLPPLFFGILCAGGVASCASPGFTEHELSRQINHGSAKVLICNSDSEEATLKAADMSNVPRKNVLVLASDPELGLFDLDGKNLLSDKVLDWVRLTDPVVIKNTTACILYSSGTTGPPKVAAGYLFGSSTKTYWDEIGPAEKWDHKTVAHLPTAHIAGILFYCISPSILNGTVYWMRKFDFPSFLKHIKRYSVTSVFTVPPIILLIAKTSFGDELASLRQLISGAAPLGKDVLLEANAKLNNCSISQIWGLTETTGSVLMLPANEVDLTGSVGRLLPGVQLRLVDDDGNDVKPGERGEIICKGPMIVNGYYGNPEATKDLFKDGWLQTGDIGVYNPENALFYIVDRKKEMIKYKGAQVAPAELESVLMTHPSIADAAVIGVPGEGTELPKAYVVKKEEITEQQVKDFIKERLSNYKQLRGGVEFINEIPRSQSGKTLRKNLRLLNQTQPKL